MSRPVADGGGPKMITGWELWTQLANGRSALSLLAVQFTSVATVARIASHQPSPGVVPAGPAGLRRLVFIYS